jgi:non-ribosomal peptide synthetase component E (peptide arylation enzyme)
MSLPSRILRAAISRPGMLARKSPLATTSRVFLSSQTGGSMLAQIAKENPYKDVVRYEHKNRKWNLHHVDYYSEALAIGLLENGLQPGDVVLSWLPAHFSESVSYIMCMR